MGIWEKLQLKWKDFIVKDALTNGYQEKRKKIQEYALLVNLLIGINQERKNKLFMCVFAKCAKKFKLIKYNSY